MNQQLDNKLKIQVNKYINDGITHIRTIQKLLYNFVKNEISDKVPLSSRSFYPTRKVIYNYVLKYTYQSRSSKIDQVALQKKIYVWHDKVGGNFYYRCFDESRSQSFMFSYQSKEQQYLLQRYGAVVLLDATYKTTKYALPLFCLVVKTNIGYIICGIFVIQFENADSIAEGLNVFKQWNHDWNPEYFLVDFSDAEINAIERVFGVPIYICDFHREQSWLRWLKKKENVDSADAIVLLKFFRKLAKSRNDEEFSRNLDELCSSSEYQRNPKVEAYLKNTWIPHKSKWTCAFFNSKYSFVIRTNNGIEAQNKLLKYSYLKLHSDKSLCGVLDIIILEFFVDEIQKYRVCNSRLSENCRQYNEVIPKFLHNRPVYFIEHVHKRWATAQSVYCKNDITVLRNEEKSICLIKSEENPKIQYFVDLSIPNCTCEDFYSYVFPCKHMLAIFIYIPDFSFETSLPLHYVNSPYLTIDPKFSLFETEF